MTNQVQICSVTSLVDDNITSIKLSDVKRKKVWITLVIISLETCRKLVVDYGKQENYGSVLCSYFMHYNNSIVRRY